MFTQEMIWTMAASDESETSTQAFAALVSPTNSHFWEAWLVVVTVFLVINTGLDLYDRHRERKAGRAAVADAGRVAQAEAEAEAHKG